MKLNTASASTPIFTHEGGKATPTDAIAQLRRSVLTCMLWEDGFYEKGSEVAARIASLIPQVGPATVAAMAIEARDKMNLRHVPLFLLAELSKVKGAGPLVAASLACVIQRADELSEFLAIYWREGRHPIAAGVKRGLAAAFTKFNAYALAKYNRDSKIKLRDVLFMVHAKPSTEEQAALWKKLIDGTLESPDTWEVALSAGADKKATFERLLTEGKLGGLAVLRNLRNMQQAKVDDSLIRARLAAGCSRAFPYRFVIAAKYAPTLEDAIETAMFSAAAELEPLPGRTGLLIDVSGSMDYKLGNHNESRFHYQSELRAAPQETSRIDVASGLAILLREKAEQCAVATFSAQVTHVPPRRGFALRDAIAQSQLHASTELKKALTTLRPDWFNLDRLIIITDEQSQDGITTPWLPKSYVINVASNANGVSCRNGWHHIDGWSERVIDYIRAEEAMAL
jgi:TROVE domain-containing protein